jgi:hypothetical protein
MLDWTVVATVGVMAVSATAACTLTTSLTDVPLDHYEVAGWSFYAKYLADYGKEEWVFSDPVRKVEALK